MKSTPVRSPLGGLFAILAAGLAGVVAGEECAAPRYELAQTSSVTRGERIQPLGAGKAHPTVMSNVISTPVSTNLAAADLGFDVRRSVWVSFDQLAGFSLTLDEGLEYATNAPLADAQINAMLPAPIRALEGKAIRINGYMTPVEFEGGKTKSFILSRNPSGCCFGDMPLIHEMIEVRMNGEGTPVLRYVPVQVLGVLHVGAKRSGEVLTSIYRLEARSVIEAAR